MDLEIMSFTAFIAVTFALKARLDPIKSTISSIGLKLGKAT